MTKKHYVMFAEKIFLLMDKRTRVLVATIAADIFTLDNPRFDRGRFYKACGIES